MGLPLYMETHWTDPAWAALKQAGSGHCQIFGLSPFSLQHSRSEHLPLQCAPKAGRFVFK